MADERAAGPPEPLDLRIDQPHTARVYDYFLGGKTHYDVDRKAGDQVIAIWPDVLAAARANRTFMRRAVRVLAAEYGIGQFLDIGTGIPTEPNLHQVVQEENPRARVLYVDNDPIVLAHARALMNSSPEGRTAYLHADVTEPESVLRSPELARTLDLSRPVALSVVGLLHFVPDESDAYGLMEQFTAELPSGSALVVSHATGDFDAESMEKVAQIYKNSGTTTQLRSKEELTRFFRGFDVVEPGIEVPPRWRPDAKDGVHIGSEPAVADDAALGVWVGVAIKP